MAGKVDVVTIRCLGTVKGPRFLRGMMRGDRSVVLVTLKNGQGDDTFWRRTQNSTGRLWNLDCLGRPPPGVNPDRMFLAGTRNGRALLEPQSDAPDGKPDIWRARVIPDVSFGFTLENIGLRDVGAPAFLDGRTQNGSVGFAQNTDPPFTGTRWEIRPLPNKKFME
jgi:hypothetical protein